MKLYPSLGHGAIGAGPVDGYVDGTPAAPGTPNPRLIASITKYDVIPAVNLTTLGGDDYLVGRAVNNTYNRKLGGTLIGVPTENFAFDDNVQNPTGYSVSGTDGTPTGSFTYTSIYGSYSSNNETWSVVISGIGIAKRNIKFFAGSLFGDSSVTATLSDGSVAPLTLFRNANGVGSGEYFLYELECAAGSQNQTLTLTFTAFAPSVLIGWLWVGSEEAGQAPQIIQYPQFLLMMMED